MLVLVYGTLKRGGVLHHHMKGARFVGEDAVANCELYFFEWYPAVVRGNGHIHGEVYEINDEKLELLDDVEGEGSLFKQHLLDTIQNQKVWVYLYLHSVSTAQRIKSGVFDVKLSQA